MLADHYIVNWKSGTAIPADPAEVAAVRWMTASEAIAHPETPPWTRLGLALAEKALLERGW
ncbi:MAG: hypothetical protein M8467_05690 [Anaerolineae bacterium]|nr:hypothetical protein [Anaerolineae bacterium]